MSNGALFNDVGVRDLEHNQLGILRTPGWWGPDKGKYIADTSTMRKKHIYAERDVILESVCSRLVEMDLFGKKFVA